MNASRTAFLACVVVAPLAAQWLDFKTPGIPRQPDGKPNLSAPVPRTADGKPDLSGQWFLRYSLEDLMKVTRENLKPWASTVSQQRLEGWGKDDPSTFKCLPRGPGAFFGGFPVGGETHIVQTPGVTAVLYSDLAYRRIFTDGRALPKNPNPTFMGYSVGRWDGDTLVVNSAGFNDRTSIGQSGPPHTEALRITERYHRTDFGHMEVEVSFEDAEAFNKPWILRVKAVFMADTDILEYVCNDNEKDGAHISGKTTDDLKYAVKVAPQTLAKYVGTYVATFPFPFTLEVSVSGDEMTISKQPAIPLSERRFSWIGKHIEFVMDDQGKVAYVGIETPEGLAKALPRPAGK